MVTVPGLRPLTIPVVLPIVASIVLLLYQVPPLVASLNDVVAPLPAHTDATPFIIGDGAALTVTILDDAHPVAAIA